MSHTTTSFLALFVACAVGVGLFVESHETRIQRAEIFSRLAALEQRVADIDAAVEILVASARSSQDELAALVARYGSQTEEARVSAEALRTELETLSGAVSQQQSDIVSLSQVTDTAALIERWSPYVYDISCLFEKDDGNKDTGSASAVLERTLSGVRFLTSKHVVEMDEATLVHCTLVAPDHATTSPILAKDITLDPERDFAFGPVPGVAIGMLPWQTCSTAPAIGERVVILGYPTIGAKASITATEGILSGFDDIYYTTSAKIEKGNSGGAAIDVRRDCFLGLPTSVLAGRIESLARILPLLER